MLTGANRLMQLEKGHFDGHAHVFRHDLPMLENRRYTPEYDALMVAYVEHLRVNQLDGGLLVQPSFLGADNAFMLASMLEYANDQQLTFRGTAVLESSVDEAELFVLDKAGIIGLRLNLVGQDSFDVVDWIPLLRRIDRLNWHLEIHCEGGRLSGVLRDVLPYCRTVVVDHFGLPRVDDAFNCSGQQAILAAPKRQIMVKTSAPYRVFPKVSSQQAAMQCSGLFTRFYEYLGPDALLWGSDWPWTRFEQGHDFAGALQWEKMWISG